MSPFCLDSYMIIMTVIVNNNTNDCSKNNNSTNSNRDENNDNRHSDTNNDNSNY